MLCITNMLLHDIDVPQVYHNNSLLKDVLDYTEDDQFDVILYNPPYGGSESKYRLSGENQKKLVLFFFAPIHRKEVRNLCRKNSKTNSLESLQAELEKAERKKKYYEQQEKILTRKVIPKLTRAERTNRLCTRAGMLESFLVHPELLSNDQVMDLLKIAFRQKEVNEALNEMLKTVTEETS